ncbi:DUF3102 domain-containing protein [Brevibacterium sp. RIT 803]|uniref:DUF3102 domain-containing protein n=1 Tax=Brevibacterium sp. RIT 803 TaxID=2810210 RepID=UPI001951941F|nr:DUF3102 domain-containing protein [Brevibacterium sp. RIT 803]MBM6589854.1 DUF3102 domain-containing protein [Brevibacterium sp. RIT 803]
MAEITRADTIRTGPEWATIIRDDLNRAVEGLISAGQHLTQAKADVNHGEWIPMLNGIGISQSHASHLMQIGRNLNQSDPTDLPRTVTALYELSQLDPEDIEHGVEDGTIHPDMTTQDAKNLKQEPEKTTAFEKAMKNLKALRKNADRLSFTERDEVIATAERIITELGGRK